MKTVRMTICLMAALVLAVGVSPVLAAVRYNITDLGTPVGSVSYATGVNNAGQVVGYVYPYNHGNVKHAFLYSNGVMTDLGTPGGQMSYATGINDAGQVVGYCNRYSFSANFTAFLYSNGVMTPIGPSADYVNSRAAGINNAGQVVGWGTFNEIGNKGFIYSNGAMTYFGGGPWNATQTEATCINNAGQVAGNASIDILQAFIYSGGHRTDLGTLGGSGSWATGINDSGQVVGYHNSPDQGPRHAFLYSNGVMTDLGGTLGEMSSYAAGINDSGQIVGWVGEWDAVERAFISDGVNITDLNKLIDPASGWMLERATAISDNGYIVGCGSNSWKQTAFLLTPIPEPATLLLHDPNGGEVLGGLQIYTISWSNTGSISNVLIEYSTNNDGVWNDVNTVSNTGSYSWLVPAVNSNQCLVRISDAANPAIYDISDNVFTIISENPSEYPTLYEILGGSAPDIEESGRDFVTLTSPDANLVAFILLESAGFANENVFGIYSAYDPQQKLQLFAGSNSPTDTTIVQFNFTDSNAQNLQTGQTANIGKYFGFYLTTPQNGGITYYTDLTRNPDSSEHGLIFNTSGFAGVIENDPDTVIAFEDFLGLGDRDYNDMVVGIINAIPLPGSGPYCIRDIPGDANHDCKVDYEDFAIMASHWLECNLDPQSACR